MSLFHHHKWELVVEKTLSAPIAPILKDRTLTHVKGGDPDLWSETHIVILKCPCGRIKEIVNRSLP